MSGIVGSSERADRLIGLFRGEEGGNEFTPSKGGLGASGIVSQTEWFAGMISFIVPAHNEELLIGATLQSIHDAARQAGGEYELIVVDDASADHTAAIARDHGATVISVNKRQISAVRNAGAQAAHGEFLIFVDADTLANAAAVQAVQESLAAGAVGGGCLFRFDGQLPFWARLTYPLGIFLFRLFSLVGGCFVFCTREAFFAIGGFSEECFAAEEVHFRNDLRRQGKFVIPQPLVVTSGRKVRTYSAFEIIKILWRLARIGPRAFSHREGLDVWYGERRQDPFSQQQSSGEKSDSPFRCGS